MKPNAVDPECYQLLLKKKSEAILQAFSEFRINTLEVFPSASQYYRMRAEFRIWHESNRLHYAMFVPGDNTRPVFIDSFPAGSKRINTLMPVLLEYINERSLLCHRLFQLDFLTTQSGQALITLIYHHYLGDDWVTAAKELEKEFGIYVIGRSRKQRRVLSQDFVTETLQVNDRIWQYLQYENSFTQPNAGVNEKMLEWVETIVSDTREKDKRDLVELYCGNGNFTCVMAPHFKHVLATEISKTSVKSAKANFLLNDIDNINVVRISSEEFTQALNKERLFRRLANIDLDSFDFGTIFVDPPRAGVDDKTLDLLKRFERILYISCNPKTLHQNLQVLTESHQIERFALFDQFPYTHHAECGVYLIQK